MEKIRVLLADDHTIFREGLRDIIDSQSDMVVVGEAEDGVEAVNQAEELAPDVILMDVRMPRLGGIEATHLIRERVPEANVIILTMYAKDEYFREALQAGMRGYILKDVGVGGMLQAIRAVHGGEVSIDPSLASRALTKLCREAEDLEGIGPDLDARDKEILSLVVKGATNREIAEGLLISEQTVRNRLSSLFKKLKVRNRTEAAVYAVREGLVTAV